MSFFHYPLQRLLHGAFRQHSGIDAHLADEAEVVNIGAADAVQVLFLLQQAGGEFVVTFGEAPVKRPEVVPGIQQTADKPEDGTEEQHGYDGENDEGDVVMLDTDHQLLQLVQDIIHRDVS